MLGRGCAFDIKARRESGGPASEAFLFCGEAQSPHGTTHEASKRG